GSPFCLPVPLDDLVGPERAVRDLRAAEPYPDSVPLEQLPRGFQLSALRSAVFQLALYCRDGDGADPLHLVACRLCACPPSLCRRRARRALSCLGADGAGGSDDHSEFLPDPLAGSQRYALAAHPAAGLRSTGHRRHLPDASVFPGAAEGAGGGWQDGRAVALRRVVAHSAAYVATGARRCRYHHVPQFLEPVPRTADLHLVARKVHAAAGAVELHRPVWF